MHPLQERKPATSVCVPGSTLSAPGSGHRLRLGHSQAGEGTDDTGPLFLTLGCAGHMGTCALGLPPALHLSLHLREAASVPVEPMSWGCSLERSDLASSHFQTSPCASTLTSLHDTGVTDDQDGDSQARQGGSRPRLAPSVWPRARLDARQVRICTARLQGDQRTSTRKS